MNYRVLCLAFVALSLASPAAARIDLTAEEREIVEWSATSAPALAILEAANAIHDADEGLRRMLVIDQCAALPKGADRLTHRKYIAQLLEASRIVSEAIRKDGHLTSDRAAAFVYAWRGWNQQQRQEWLALMRSPDGRRGFEVSRVHSLIEDIGFMATDVATGATTGSPFWAGWAHEALVKTNLVPSFVRAANALQPGLGDRFIAEAAKAAGWETLSDAQRQTLVAVSRDVASRWPAMEATLKADWLAASGAKRLMDAWDNHPLVRRIVDLELNMNRQVGAGGEPPSEFLQESGRGQEHTTRRVEMVTAALRPRSKAICDSLR